MTLRRKGIITLKIPVGKDSLTTEDRGISGNQRIILKKLVEGWRIVG